MALPFNNEEGNDMKRLMLVVLAVLLAGAVGVAAYYTRSNDAAHPSFTTAVLTSGPVVSRVEATGTLQAVTTVAVGSQVSGTISSLHADFNSRVRKGQVLARLEPSLFQTQVEQAEATVQRLQADVERAVVEAEDAAAKLRRAEQLSTQQLIAASDLDTARTTARQAEAALKSARAQVAQARAAVNQSRVNLGHATITAPVDGIVVSRNVDVGQTVAASMQAPTLFVLAEDLARMQVNASVDESDIGRIQPGQQVTFQVDAYPDQVFTGSVRQVRLDPVVEQNVVSYVTVIDVPNPELKLKPGMTANVSVEIARADHALRVPNAAFRFRPDPEVLQAMGRPQRAQSDNGQPATGRADERRGQRDDRGGQSVWVLTEAGLRRTPVQTGVNDGTVTAITGGDLPEGARVVTGVAATGPTAARSGGSPLIPQRPGRGGNCRANRTGRRAMTPVIALRDIERVYTLGEVRVHALRGITLDVQPGEFVMLTGPSGSGKSTLMHLLGLLDQPSKGEYLLNGQDVAALDTRSLAHVRNREIGFVFQGFNLLPRTTALENVELPMLYGPRIPAAERRSRATDALKAVGLGERLDHHPNQLSGGQQQRVAIARALVNTPVLLLADEPTGNLDTRTSIEVMGILQRLNAQGLTIVLVTHEPEIAEYGTRIVAFRDGRVRSDTPITARRRAEDDLAAFDAEAAADALSA